MLSKELTVNGIKIECFDDGSILLPKSGNNPEHRTFGSNHGNDTRKSGYLCVKIAGRNYKVHRLICQAFHDNPKGYPEVDHIDRDRKNNKPENLRWVTRQANCCNTVKSDRVTKEIGVHFYEDKEKYNLIRSRQYEKNHTRIDLVNKHGKKSRVICTAEEYEALKQLKQSERLKKLEELRNGNKS